ncbi:MAG: hypothetical protein HKN13_00630, partial [Rhodothermales bacterium]|nr:hypothetical protein [Rhodothermales bacterium]
TSQNVIVRAFALPAPGLTRSATDTLTLSSLVASETVSQHLVYLRVLLDINGTPTMTDVDSVNWSGIGNRTLIAKIPQDLLPASEEITVEIASTNEFGSGTPNNLLLDWVDARFVRNSSLTDGVLRINGRQGGTTTYTVSNLSQDARVLNPISGESFTVTPTSGSASFAIESPGAEPVFWVVEQAAYKQAAAIKLDQNSGLVASSNSADYVIITAPDLIPSATAMAAHRQTAVGGAHQTMVVNIYDVFDEFDYGRPTPLAIRRFVRHASQEWGVPLQYLTLWGDALYALRTRPLLGWEVPAFGHTVSDSWFGMQNGGLADYSESISIGRIPIRTNESGNIFVDKIQTYESQPLSTWQKRALFLAGGFTPSERTRLQQSALKWSGMAAADPMGMDTLHYFKTSASVLDPTFQDSLQAELVVGASWEVYFGHSATQTWEIVTDPPAQYNNATRLPIVLSLGCFTGDFATGSGDSGDILSYSEQLVVESVNGSIAHWGASSSGTIGASSRISDEVHQSVFADTVRVLGDALRIAKSRYNDKYNDPISIKHLLQYGLIGDPATRISLPSQPDFRIEDSDIRITPLAPVPADRELTIDVGIRNVGLTTIDSVAVEVVHTLPNSTTTTISRTLPAFGSETEEQFRVDLSDATVGLNRIFVAADVDDRYAESNELNNQAEQPVTVFASGLSVLTPANFGLFPSTDVTLTTSSSSDEASPPPTRFQLDTEPTFDSPNLVEATIPTVNLVAQWQPPGLTDGTYFWRARVDIPEQEDVWTSGAFTIDVARGETGWLQTGTLFDENSVSPTLLPHDNGWALNTFDIVVSVSSERGAGVELGQFAVGSEIYERLGLGFGVLVQDGRDGSVLGSTSGPTYANDFVNPVTAYNNLVETLSLAREGDYVFVRTRHLGNKNGETVVPDSVKALFTT